MDRVSQLFAEINDGAPIDSVREGVIELTRSFINEFGESIDAWEKSCIASAIGNLSWNMSLQSPVSETGLRLCLHNLAKSLTPADLRSQDYPVKEDHLANITSQDLSQAIDAIVE